MSELINKFNDPNVFKMGDGSNVVELSAPVGLVGIDKSEGQSGIFVFAKESYDVYSQMEKYDDVYSLNSQIKDQIEDILRRNFDIKTNDIPFSSRGGNN